MRRQRLTQSALNRALLARQGLVERFRLPVAAAVASMGAIQAQFWPAPPVALWSRVAGFDAGELYDALDRGRLVLGPLVRGTLHIVSSGDHAQFAASLAASGVADWRRTPAPAGTEIHELRSALLAYARPKPRDQEELVQFIESWVGQHPDALDPAELSAQRSVKWRPFRSWSGLIRAPADGRWGARAPASQTAPPSLPPDWPAPEEALAAVIRRHLGAFGPAAPDDVAAWLGWRTPAVRAAIERLGNQLEQFEDERGRVLYDLPGAPRPDPGLAPPIRLLPWFDSVLLAYAPQHRERILPAAYRDRVYVRANLQWLPTFLVDGLVAGTWSVEAGTGRATLTLRAFGKLPKPVRTALREEAESLLRFSHPASPSREVVEAETA